MKLFERMSIGSLQLKNRVVMAPMGTTTDHTYGFNERDVAYYGERSVAYRASHVELREAVEWQPNVGVVGEAFHISMRVSGRAPVACFIIDALKKYAMTNQIATPAITQGIVAMNCSHTKSQSMGFSTYSEPLFVCMKAMMAKNSQTMARMMAGNIMRSNMERILFLMICVCIPTYLMSVYVLDMY